MALPLNTPRGEALDEMLAENQVQRQHWYIGQRKHCEDFGPVGLILAEQARYAQQQRFRLFVGNKYQGEPEVVPERDHVVYRHCCDGGAQQRDHYLCKNLERAGAVDQRGLPSLTVK